VFKALYIILQLETQSPVPTYGEFYQYGNKYILKIFRGKFMSLVTINLPEEVFSARRLNPEEFVRDMGFAAGIYSC